MSTSKSNTPTSAKASAEAQSGGRKIQQYRYSAVPPVAKGATASFGATKPAATTCPAANLVPAKPVPAVPVRPANSRKAPRKPAELPVLILFEGAARPISCKVGNISATGALLRFTRGSAHSFDNPANLPDRFTLALPVERTEVDCQVVWRKDTELGVKFASIYRPMRRLPRA
jgi:hypothetical protein